MVPDYPDIEGVMTKKNHKCKDCISENQIRVDWLLDTGDLAIIIQPNIYNLRDAGKEDFYVMSDKEKEWRNEFEIIRKKILGCLND